VPFAVAAAGNDDEVVASEAFQDLVDHDLADPVEHLVDMDHPCEGLEDNADLLQEGAFEVVPSLSHWVVVGYVEDPFD